MPQKQQGEYLFWFYFKDMQVFIPQETVQIITYPIFKNVQQAAIW